MVVVLGSRLLKRWSSVGDFLCRENGLLLMLQLMFFLHMLQHLSTREEEPLTCYFISLRFVLAEENVILLDLMIAKLFESITMDV
jgi:hypothetical protein